MPEFNNEKGIIRFSVSMEEELLKRFESRISEYGFTTRSEAIRDLIRKFILEDTFNSGKDVMALLVYVYDHHAREVMDKLVSIQHDFGEGILFTFHVHLDHNRCMETAVVRGDADKLQELYRNIRSIKGVFRAMLIPASPEEHG